MTIEEARLLRWQENNREMRRPNCMITEDKTELNNIYDLVRYLASMLESQKFGIRRFMPRTMLEMLMSKIFFKKQILTEELTGKGTPDKPYKIKTKYGEATIMHALYFFKGKYPAALEKFKCFGNTLYTSYALYKSETYKKKDKVKQLTGIAYLNKPFLHSVLLIDVKGKPMVMDVNYDLIMDADSYFKMFQFETICEVPCNKLGQDWELLCKGLKYLDFDESTYYLDIAYDDVIQLIKDRMANDGIDTDDIEETVKK